MNNSITNMKYQGEGLVARVLGGGALLGVLFYAVIFISGGKIIGIAVGSGMILIIALVCSKAILNAHFSATSIKIKYLYGKEVILDYTSVSRIYKSTGFMMTTSVFVVLLKDGTKPKKFTFTCSDSEYRTLKEFLLTKDVSNVSDKSKYHKKSRY